MAILLLKKSNVLGLQLVLWAKIKEEKETSKCTRYALEKTINTV